MNKKIKLISIFLVLVLVVNIVLPTISVIASASTSHLKVTFRNNYTTEQGKVQYTLDDGATWNDLTSDFDQDIIVTGNNLKVKIVANDGYSVDYAGIEYQEDNGPSYNLSVPENGPIAGGLTGPNGYQVGNTVNTVQLMQVEFRDNSAQPGPEPGQNDGPVEIEGGTLVTGNFVYTPDDNPADIWLNETQIGVGEPPAESKDYYKDDSGNVTFTFGILINCRITSVIINDVDYSNQLPKTKAEWLEANQNQFDMVNITVPFAESYNIKTTTTMDFEWSIGNFLWSYLEEDKGTDNYIGNGKLEFVSLKFNGVTYNGLEELNAANKGYLCAGENEEGTEGEAVLPAGAELTVRLVPNAGYQLTSFTCNGLKFTPQEEVGLYTFEVPSGNFHWGASFEKVDDKVKTNSNAVKSGTITLGGEEATMMVGTARLDVTDAEVTEDQKAKFQEKAGDFKVANVLDLSLFNTVYKGSANSSWDTEVIDLTNEAEFTLQLAESIKAEDACLVHEDHDGNYEMIEGTFDASTNTIKAKTKGFSNYAVAIKEVATTEETEGTTETSSNPTTGDNIVMYVSLFAIATVGTFIVIKLNKNKTRKH